MEFPIDPKPSEEEMVAAYVKTLAAVLERYAPCLCMRICCVSNHVELIESVNVHLT
jgi:hypothetical protein